MVTHLLALQSDFIKFCVIAFPYVNNRLVAVPHGDTGKKYHFSVQVYCFPMKTHFAPDSVVQVSPHLHRSHYYHCLQFCSPNTGTHLHTVSPKSSNMIAAHSNTAPFT